MTSEQNTIALDDKAALVDLKSTAQQRPRSGRAQTARKAAAKPNFSVTLRQWHRRVGLFAFLFMGWLGFSGFLLNQSVSWGLDAVRVKATSVMAMYGLYTEVPDTGYINGEHWLVTTTENTVVDARPLSLRIPSPVGMAVMEDADQTYIYIATESSLSIFDNDLMKLDELSDYMLPVAAIERIGSLTKSAGESGVVILGESAYISTDGISWDRLDSTEAVQWSTPQKLTDPIKESVEPFARPSVPLEQVLIDLHSGRMFGTLGTYLVNLVGFSAMGLSVTGVWMMWMTSRRRKSRSSK